MLQVLIDKLQNLDRAFEFADACNEPAVWSLLGKAQLDQGSVKDAISSFIKANDPSFFEEVVRAASATDKWDDVVRFLQMTRKTMRDKNVDSELAFAFAKTNRMSDLEEFISGSNHADVTQVSLTFRAPL